MPAKKKLTDEVRDTVKTTRSRAKKAAEEVKDAVAAEEIEAKKATRKAGRKAKDQVEKAAAKAAETVADAAAVAKIEAKKTAQRGARKVKEAGAKAEAVKKEAAKPVRKAKASKMNIVIQSPMGGNITPEEIAEKVGQADFVYVRVDQNKAYWVRGDETGDVDLW